MHLWQYNAQHNHGPCKRQNETVYIHIFDTPWNESQPNGEIVELMDIILVMAYILKFNFTPVANWP